MATNYRKRGYILYVYPDDADVPAPSSHQLKTMRKAIPFTEVQTAAVGGIVPQHDYNMVIVHPECHDDEHFTHWYDTFVRPKLHSVCAIIDPGGL